MLRYRFSVAVFCALFAGGAVLGTTPSCGTWLRASVPACCKREATCPMHQKHGPRAFRFNACHSDGANTPAAVTYHRAVLTTSAGTPELAGRDRAFQTTTPLLSWASAVPHTPPPRTV